MWGRERAAWEGTGGELQRRGRSALLLLVCTVDSNAGGDLKSGLGLEGMGWVRSRVRGSFWLALGLDM